MNRLEAQWAAFDSMIDHRISIMGAVARGLILFVLVTACLIDLAGKFPRAWWLARWRDAMVDIGFWIAFVIVLVPMAVLAGIIIAACRLFELVLAQEKGS